MRELMMTLFATLASFAGNDLAADPCTPITAIPAVITAPGSYCVIGRLVTTQTSGAAIEIQADDVILDMTGGALDNGGYENHQTTAAGVFAMDRSNITVMGGLISFFAYGILLQNSAADFSSTRGHRITDMLIEPARLVGNSSDCTVRDNEIDNRTTFPLEIGVYMPGSDHIQAASNKMTNVKRHYAR